VAVRRLMGAVVSRIIRFELSGIQSLAQSVMPSSL
jgi:hypothetical protein